MPSPYTRKTNYRLRERLSPNFTALNQARSKERERERQALIARAPYDAAADAVERAERDLRLAFERLPATAPIRRELLAQAVASITLVPILRAQAEQAQAAAT